MNKKCFKSILICCVCGTSIMASTVSADEAIDAKMLEEAGVNFIETESSLA